MKTRESFLEKNREGNHNRFLLFTVKFSLLFILSPEERVKFLERRFFIFPVLLNSH